MCVIIYSPTGEIPSNELAQGMAVNPDGWGYMFPREGKLVLRKGMSTKEFWKVWKRDQAVGIESVVWHARIGTHGSLSVANCHPFVIPGHGLAVAHNGIVEGLPFHKRHSDTRQFVELLSSLEPGFLGDAALRKILELAIGRSKMVFMDGSGEVEILNADKGTYWQGRWYSNHSCWAPKKVEPVKLPAYQGNLFNLGIQR